MTPVEEVIAFWREVGPEGWYRGDAALDQKVRARFEGLWRAARDGACADWMESAEGALALILLLDQFPRNMFRHEADAFATDGLALEISKLAIEAGFDSQIPADRRQFLYMPFMHSECRADQDMSVELFDRLGQADQLRYAIMHRDLIRRFGRFPHRNEILGRQSLPEEIEAIAEGSNW